MKIYSRKWIPDWIQLILTIWVLHGLIFLPDQVIPETVPCDSFSVLFRWCSIGASSYDRHCCSKVETQLDLPRSTSPFLFVTRILSIGTNQSQSIQASIVSRSLPRHSSQLVTPFPLFEVTDPPVNPLFLPANGSHTVSILASLHTR